MGAGERRLFLFAKWLVAASASFTDPTGGRSDSSHIAGTGSDRELVRSRFQGICRTLEFSPILPDRRQGGGIAGAASLGETI